MSDYDRARVVNLEEVLRQRRLTKKSRSRAAFLKPRSEHPFIMRIPLSWPRRLRDVDAMAALPLLLAIANQMSLKRKLTVSITAKVWEVAAGRSKSERNPMLAALKRVPDLVRIEEHHRLASRYQASRGPMWDTAYPFEDENDEDEVS
jgi:hypothetical protein